MYRDATTPFFLCGMGRVVILWAQGRVVFRRKLVVGLKRRLSAAMVEEEGRGAGEGWRCAAPGPIISEGEAMPRTQPPDIVPVVCASHCLG